MIHWVMEVAVMTRGISRITIMVADIGRPAVMLKGACDAGEMGDI
jgi:hypothetical protein